MAKRNTYQTTERAGAFFYPVGLLFIIAGVLLLNGIFSFNSGKSIVFIKQLVLGLTGVVSLPFPLILLLIGIILVVGARAKVSYFPVFCLAIIYILVLAFVTVATPIHGEGYFMDFLERRMAVNGLNQLEDYLRMAFEQFHGITKPLVGGGAIGMLLAYPLWIKLGSIASIIVIALSIVVMFFVTIRFNIIKHTVDLIKKRSGKKQYQTEGNIAKGREFKLSGILNKLMNWLSLNKQEDYGQYDYDEGQNRSSYEEEYIAEGEEKPSSAYENQNSNANESINNDRLRNFEDTDAASSKNDNHSSDFSAKQSHRTPRATVKIKDIPALTEEKRYKNDYYFNERRELSEYERSPEAQQNSDLEYDVHDDYSDSVKDYGELNRLSEPIRPFVRSAADFWSPENNSNKSQKKGNFNNSDYEKTRASGEDLRSSYRYSQNFEDSRASAANKINTNKEPGVTGSYSNYSKNKYSSFDSRSNWDVDTDENKASEYDDSFNDIEEYDDSCTEYALEKGVNKLSFKNNSVKAGSISDMHMEAAFEIPRGRIAVSDSGKRDAQNTLDGQTATPLKGGLQLKLDIENYVRPTPNMLRSGITSNVDHSEEDARISRKLLDFFNNMGVNVELKGVIHGPSITRFGVNPGVGVRVDKVLKLSDDILNMFGGKRVNVTLADGIFKEMGIEIPNERPDLVTLKDVLFSERMLSEKSPTMVPLGKNLVGETVLCEITAMPHLLIAGETGSGKSACINSIITSLIYRADPREVRLILVDPKQVEFVSYEQCPHLLLPIINEPKRAVSALEWLCDEMERRYMQLKERRQKNIFSYNSRLEAGDERMPYIIMIIDELSDLMITSGKTIEIYLQRLTAKARAAGIYLILATQRPSVNVITGVIKANMPSRIAFRVSSNTDSRTILDESGADKLVGKGDMLFSASGAKLVRVQGSFITEDEINTVMDFVKENNEPVKYNSDIMEYLDKAEEEEKVDIDETENDGSYSDPLFKEALALAVEEGQVSISRIQRAFKVGFSRGGRLVDEMELRGFASRSEGGSKPRKMLISREEYQHLLECDDSRIR